ncbi:hypothetical protein SDC9_149116 [bioreactor metagenome]|uniref:Uncharacterized protein n=1 Tax=bioreactor metagenome TaxID=1076179 RepID=A0A645EMY8_9ZZZZ
MFRWLEELDHHGLHALLEIEGDAGRNVPHIQDYVARHAAWGSTALDMRGIPCAKITSQINSVQVDPAAATKYFVSALMECCLEKE